MMRFNEPSASPPHPVTLNLGRLARLIFMYYASRRQQSLSGALRSLAVALVRADQKRGAFDLAAFRKFLEKTPGVDLAQIDAVLADLASALAVYDPPGSASSAA